MTTKLQSGDTNFELLNEPSDPVQVAIEYDAESYYQTDSDPTPTVTPSGGTFTSSCTENNIRSVRICKENNLYGDHINVALETNHP